MLSSVLFSTLIFALATSAIPAGGSQSPSPNDDAPASGLNATLGVVERSIACHPGKSQVKPHSVDCVKAMLKLPTTSVQQVFALDSNPPTLNFAARSGRCLVKIELLDGETSDRSSWQYAQTMGIFLMSTCKYAFGKESRTAGAIIFGVNGHLVMTIEKTPDIKGAVGASNGTIAGDDDNDEAEPDDPRLLALFQKQDAQGTAVTSIS